MLAYKQFFLPLESSNGGFGVPIVVGGSLVNPVCNMMALRILSLLRGVFEKSSATVCDAIVAV